MISETPYHLGRREKIFKLDRLTAALWIFSSLLVMFVSITGACLYAFACYWILRGINPPDQQLVILAVLSIWQKGHYEPLT